MGKDQELPARAPPAATTAATVAGKDTGEKPLYSFSAKGKPCPSGTVAVTSEGNCSVAAAMLSRKWTTGSVVSLPNSIAGCFEGALGTDDVLYFNKDGRPAAMDERVVCRELLSIPAGCGQPLVGGVASHVMTDIGITATSVMTGSHISRSRIDYEANDFSAWAPAMAKVDNATDWIQWDLGGVVRVSAVQTKGRGDKVCADNATCEQWVETYELSYSTDELHWTSSGVLNGNSDRNSIVQNELIPAVRARFVRLNPKTWQSYPSMRVDLLGCRAAAAPTKTQTTPTTPGADQPTEYSDFQWSYADNAVQWPLNPSWMCAGNKQSPVDIVLDDIIQDKTRKFSIGAYANFFQLKDLEVKNNGRYLEVAGDIGVLSLPTGQYRAKSLQFHFPSEHAVDGTLFEGEMQVLHQREGAHGMDEIVIISLFLVTPSSSGLLDEALLDDRSVGQDSFFDSLGFGEVNQLPLPGEGMPINNSVSFQAFIANLRGPYFSYVGSLTTPPCSEGVNWLVMNEPATFPHVMLEHAMAAMQGQGSSRAVQPPNGRPISSMWTAMSKHAKYIACRALSDIQYAAEPSCKEGSYINESSFCTPMCQSGRRAVFEMPAPELVVGCKATNETQGLCCSGGSMTPFNFSCKSTDLTASSEESALDKKMKVEAMNEAEKEAVANRFLVASFIVLMLASCIIFFCVRQDLKKSKKEEETGVPVS